MVLELAHDLVLPFLFLVAASYVGTTAALRRYFGRESYRADAGRFTDRRGPGDDLHAGSSEDGE